MLKDSFSFSPFAWEFTRVVQGKQESYNRIGSESGLWALVIEIPSSTDESSNRWWRMGSKSSSFKFLQDFLICFPASASLRWQIPQFMSPCATSPSVEWQTHSFSNKWILSLLWVQWAQEGKVLTHHTAHSVLSTSTITCLHCTLSSYQQCS